MTLTTIIKQLVFIKLIRISKYEHNNMKINIRYAYLILTSQAFYLQGSEVSQYSARAAPSPRAEPIGRARKNEATAIKSRETSLSYW